MRPSTSTVRGGSRGPWRLERAAPISGGSSKGARPHFATRAERGSRSDCLRKETSGRTRGHQSRNNKLTIFEAGEGECGDLGRPVFRILEIRPSVRACYTRAGPWPEINLIGTRNVACLRPRSPGLRRWQGEDAPLHCRIFDFPRCSVFTLPPLMQVASRRQCTPHSGLPTR